MSQFRLARISLILAAIGLNAAPALMTGAHAAAPAPAVAPKPDTIRPDLFKLLDPALVQKLMSEKKYAEIQDKITQAELVADRTPYETYVIDRMKLVLGSTTGNDAMAMKALEAVIASGRTSAEEQPRFIQAMGNFHYNAKNYPKAIEWYLRYQKESPTPLLVRNALIRSYYLNNDYVTAMAALKPVIAEAEAAGKAPVQEDLRLLTSSATKLKDTATYAAGMEKLVAYYPTDEFWTDMLHRLANKPNFNQRLILDLFRLETMAISTLASEEYTELAELALIAGFPTEAKTAIDAGFAAGVLGTDSNAAKHKQLRDRANKGAADDAKNIASGEASANKSKDGTGLTNLGYAYVSMGQFDKGIALMEQGIAKGGLKRADDAKLHLGVAYAKAGRKADAVKVFESIKADDGLADLAKYWMVWLNRPVAASAAPAPAPATTK
jgi:tetratricopeptide (TPR) repeat protein